MNCASPESRGVASAALEKFLRHLDAEHLVTHDVIVARGDDILLETYVRPFSADRLHRIYSASKSMTALAVGFAVDDGLLSLDDEMIKYFEADMEGQTDENFRHQTLRNMLMMSTAKPCMNWFLGRTPDRVRFYWQNPLKETRRPGERFEYDSSGTFVVGALVERLTGMRFMDYLHMKLFNKIGVSGAARCLSCPGGHSWADSGCLMTARDLLLTARFTMNGGSWNGEQLLSREYVKEATSNLISTGDGTKADQNGYGYYIWKTWGEGWFFYGMGCQLAVCVPEKDLILVYNGDNQENTPATHEVIRSFFDMVVAAAGDALPEDRAAQDSLKAYAGGMKLMAAWDDTGSPRQQELNGVTYRLDENPMGIRQFTLWFDDRGGCFSYVNAQGEKQLVFGFGENRFGTFPQYGYSNQIGSQKGTDPYGYAASAAWQNADTLRIKLQMIGDYFGNGDMFFTFDGDGVKLKMIKTAEDFLNEYQGEAAGRAVR